MRRFAIAEKQTEPVVVRLGCQCDDVKFLSYDGWETLVAWCRDNGVLHDLVVVEDNIDTAVSITTAPHGPLQR